jgi:hypothetical protein
MKHHICQLPDVMVRRFHCRECGWNWVVHPIAKLWFRDAPASAVTS